MKCGVKLLVSEANQPVWSEEEAICDQPKGHKGSHSGTVTRSVSLTWTARKEK